MFYVSNVALWLSVISFKIDRNYVVVAGTDSWIRERWIGAMISPEYNGRRSSFIIVVDIKVYRYILPLLFWVQRISGCTLESIASVLCGIYREYIQFDIKRKFDGVLSCNIGLTIIGPHHFKYFNTKFIRVRNGYSFLGAVTRDKAINIVDNS